MGSAFTGPTSTRTFGSGACWSPGRNRLKQRVESSASFTADDLGPLEGGWLCDGGTAERRTVPQARASELAWLRNRPPFRRSAQGPPPCLQLHHNELERLAADVLRQVRPTGIVRQVRLMADAEIRHRDKYPVNCWPDIPVPTVWRHAGSEQDLAPSARRDRGGALRDQETVLNVDWPAGARTARY